MPDDPIEIKPSFLGITVNVNELWRRLLANKTPDSVAVVAKRFVQLFNDHGVPTTQIPRLITQLTLQDLQSPDKLLPALTGDVLDEAARLFLIRRSWIEGVDDQVYDALWCYKAPEQFFNDLSAMKIESGIYPVRAIVSEELDGSREKEQPVAFVLVEKVASLGENDVFRYRIYGDDWNWGYWKCRIQLKAMVRLIDQVLHVPVPMYRTDLKTLRAIQSGSLIPHAYLGGRPLSNVSLEDYALSPEQSVQSKEAAELPHVLDYIQTHNLETIAKGALKKSNA